MKLIVKKLQGGECSLEVQPSTCISEIKQKVAEQLKIPIAQQKLLFLGRTLVDEQTLESYPTIKDGSKLNLIVKKQESLYDAAFRCFKKSGMSDSEADIAAKKLPIILREKIYQMSWDDIERLAADYLGLPQKQSALEPEDLM